MYMKDDKYYFHQTPVELAKELIKYVDVQQNESILEPFKGEGAFYNNFPLNTQRFYTELEDGLDYKTFTDKVDWVVSNPPFAIDGKNAFWMLLKHFLSIARKGIAFLGNDYCFSTLTPNRLKELNDAGWYVHKVVVCSVKKWRGRYFFIIFKKVNNGFYNYLLPNY